MTDFTAHFRFTIPDFNQEPWHADLIASIRAIDTAIYQALLVQSVDFWANSTVYAVGAIVLDAVTGFMWTCSTANTSAASPTTFATERSNHPSYWSPTANIPQQRGNWQTATTYVPGDFVVESNRYAVCLIGHVSGTFNTDVSNGLWVILIDLSALGVGFNAEAEGTIAAAATTNIGGQSPTRLHVTGSAVITSLGVVANTYKILRFAAGSTLTHSANLILFGSDITTEADDVAICSSDSTGKWRFYGYQRASGAVLGQPDASESTKGIAELATQAETNTGTDDVRIVTPLKMATYVSNAINTAVNTILGGVSSSFDTLAEIASAINLLAPKANPIFTGTADFQTVDTDNLTVNTGLTLPAGSVELADLVATAKPFLNLYFAQDSRASNTGGQSITQNAWTKRALTEVVDNIGGSISSDVISLPAGTYWVEGWSTIGVSLNVGGGSTIAARFGIRVRNTTDNTSLVGSGWSASGSDSGAGGNDNFNVRLHVRGLLVVGSSKSLELQTWSSLLVDTTADGGRAANTGEVEIYSEIAFYKIG